MKRLIGKMIVISGVVVALAGCGSSASSGPTQSNPAPTTAAATTTWTTAPGDAASQPAPADATGQPAPDSSQQAPGGSGKGVMGQVVSIEGTTMVLKGQGDQGTEINVTLNDSTKYTKQATMDIASVPAGETVTAMGIQEGTVFTATQVRVGATADAGAGPNGTPQAGGPGGDQQGAPNGTPQAGGPGGDQQGQQGGTPPSGGQGDAAQPGGQGQRGGGQRISGTVESVADGVLTVKIADGTSVQIHLAENGQVTQQVAGTQADVTVGAQVVVVGAQTDSAVTATQVNVMPAAAKQQ